jgi:hypothetical protein
VFSHPLRTLRPFRPVINRSLEPLQPKPEPSPSEPARPSGAAEFTPLAPRHLQVLGSPSRSVSSAGFMQMGSVEGANALEPEIYLIVRPLSLL